ncbi:MULTISPECIES: hypothetical protein [Sphingobacterium]|uniref:hypothetical protein n=1 Tax=Sphingobacterium TaxID=28453 RepID=UPI0013DD21BC|nr:MULTISPECIES: hypothetical protein [unclassified Sphingobacterium]
MKIRNIFWITICSLLWLSCSKKTAIEEIEASIPKEPTEEVTPNPKPIFEKRQVRLEMREYYTDQNIDENYFLGSIWHLKDTIQGLRLESLKKIAKDTKFHILSYNDPSIDIGFFEPNYNSILTYANKFKKSGQFSSMNFSKTTFADYAEIQGYLGYSKDVQQVLSLVRHSDSTTVQKKYNTLLYNNLNKLTLFVDYLEYDEAYPDQVITPLKKEGYNPYLLASVTYGSQLILMGESDSTRVSLNLALEKLLDSKPLDNTDLKVLERSRVLFYYRGGGKESFVQYPKGAKAVQSTVTELLAMIKQTENIFNYPLKYSFMSMADYSVLSTYNIYNMHIKK